jgi:hypothetical protein
VFTNADKKHAEICLNILGIADCFQVRCHTIPKVNAFALHIYVLRRVDLGVCRARPAAFQPLSHRRLVNLTSE